MFLKHLKAFSGALSCLLISGTICAQNYPAVLDVNNLNGRNGFEIPAIKTGDRIGTDVDFIGDLNGDGFDDIIIGSQEENNTGFELGGTAYIVFGSDKPFAPTFDLNSLDGTNGFIVYGISEDERRGIVAKGVGDVNNDGIDDVVIGTERDKHIILYGKNGSFPSKMTVNDINGSNGFIILQNGLTEITAAGDVNGDGIGDIILGYPHWNGETWVIFGKNGNFPATIDASYINGINGFIVSAAQHTSRASYLVGAAGDVNHDGYDDIIIGNWADTYSTKPNLTHVVLGRPAPFPVQIDINALNGSNGFAIENYGGFLKWVGKVGDVNGDGIDDFFSDNAVIMGSSKPFPAVLTRDNTLNGSKGFEIPNGASPFAAAGDLNFDGVDDFMVVASYQEVYVIYGSKNGFDAVFDIDDLDGTKGFKINNLSISNSGRPIAGGRDFNGDGKADFIIGSEFTNSKGVVYVVFGGDHVVLPLVNDYPKISGVSFESFNWEVKAQEKGIIYYAVYNGKPYGAIQPGGIRSGHNAIKSGAVSVEDVNTVITEAITGLVMGNDYSLYLYQEDEIGNIGTVYKVENITTLNDTQGPNLVCPSDQNINGSVLPDFLHLVEVIDNRDPNPQVVQSPAAGKQLIEGMTITITANDDLNNYSFCTFKVFSVPTSIDAAIPSGIKVYPNPVKNKIYIDGAETYQYSILNSLGQKCLEGVTNAVIDADALNAGFYTIQLYTQDGQLHYQQKLVKE
jgi:hypothetical protein